MVPQGRSVEEPELNPFFTAEDAEDAEEFEGKPKTLPLITLMTLINADRF